MSKTFYMSYFVYQLLNIDISLYIDLYSYFMNENVELHIRLVILNFNEFMLFKKDIPAYPMGIPDGDGYGDVT